MFTGVTCIWVQIHVFSYALVAILLPLKMGLIGNMHGLSFYVISGYCRNREVADFSTAGFFLRDTACFHWNSMNCDS